jgi:5-formyltetrahydrofolate cyclo-ligase
MLRRVIHAGAVAESNKSVLRRQLRLRRDEEPQPLRQQRSDGMLACAKLLLDLTSGPVAGFQPTNREPDISPLLRALAADTAVFLPRPQGDDLEWLAADQSHLVADLTGIPRPVGATAAVGAQIVTELGVQLLLVPALAIDPATGTRLGYGAGYYDRLLAGIRAQSRVLAVGVCRDEELVDLPAEPHDQPVDAVLTESGFQSLPLAH